MRRTQAHTERPERAEGAEVVSFAVPLPPAALRGNSRAHWATRKKAADEYSRAIYGWWLASDAARGEGPWPLDAASVEYAWCYAGVAPDLDNVTRSIKVLQDTLCCAPSNGRMDDYKDRHFLGLVRNDSAIEPVTVRRVKVMRRAAECVVVTIERLEAE